MILIVKESSFRHRKWVVIRLCRTVKKINKRKPPSSPPQKRHELNADSAPHLKRKALYILLLRKTEVGKLT